MAKFDTAETVPYADDYSTKPEQPVAWLNVTKIIREQVPLNKTKNGLSIGEMVDQYIATSLRSGDEVQTLEINFEREQWEALRS